MTTEPNLPPTVQEYLGAVREHMALRGVPSDTVGAQIQELKNHLFDSGADPVTEFGPPDDYAEQIADAVDTPGWVRWARPALAYISTALLMLGITVIAGGGSDAVVTGDDIKGVLPFAVLGAGAVSITAARGRDQIRGVGNQSTSGVATYMAITMIAAIALAGVGALLISDDAAIAFGSLPSWLVGIGCWVIAAATGWWAIIKPSLSPRFPTGSRLRTSQLSRRVTSKAQ